MPKRLPYTRVNGQVHNSNIAIKTRHRIAALETATTGNPHGTLYVPYAGFGECAQAANYPDQRIIGCDIDKAAVEWWHTNKPKAHITHQRGQQFTDWREQKVTLGDLDAYGAPYATLEHLLLRGNPAPTIEIVLTDGNALKRVRSKRPYNFKTHKFETVHSIDAKEQQSHFVEELTVWIQSLGWDLLLHDHQTTRLVSYMHLTLTTNLTLTASRAAHGLDRETARMLAHAEKVESAMIRRFSYTEPP